MRQGTSFAALLFFLLFCCMACQTPANEQAVVQSGFYHWKSTFQPDSLDRAYLSHLNTKQLYIRFFDIDWDANRQMAVPLAELHLGSSPIPLLTFIPTIFITNRCMLQLPEAAIPDLAQKIKQKVNTIWGTLSPNPLRHFQVDCDWTGKSRANYFQLLKDLQQALGDSVELSATIRLHQIKYARQTGIPPVDRGMLMFYNTGEIKQWDTQNSILDLATAQAYLGPMPQYPLALDIALPLFRWGIIFREDQLLHLVNGLDAQALVDSSRFIEIAPQRYELKKNTYLNGHYLYQGDRIRLESIAADDLVAAAQMLKKNQAEASFSVVFYHLDAAMIRAYPPDFLEEVIQQFE